MVDVETDIRLMLNLYVDSKHIRSYATAKFISRKALEIQLICNDGCVLTTEVDLFEVEVLGVHEVVTTRIWDMIHSHGKVHWRQNDTMPRNISSETAIRKRRPLLVIAQTCKFRYEVDSIVWCDIDKLNNGNNLKKCCAYCLLFTNCGNSTILCGESLRYLCGGQQVKDLTK